MIYIAGLVESLSSLQPLIHCYFSDKSQNLVSSTALLYLALKENFRLQIPKGSSLAVKEAVTYDLGNITSTR